jgi:hypothetical protein
MPMQRSACLPAVAAAVALAALSMRATAAAQEAISAFATWHGEGEVVHTAPDEMTFVGALDGVVYVNTAEGPVEAGQLVCPAVVRINGLSGKQAGSANCTMIAQDGARLFTELSCTGVHLVGCSGQMTLIGGSGRFEGVSGGGEFTLRSSLNYAEPKTEASAQEGAHGILFWPKLQYQLPGQGTLP